MASTLYIRAGLSASATQRVAGALAPWTQIVSANFGTGAKSIVPFLIGQSSIITSAGSQPSGDTGIAQYISPRFKGTNSIGASQITMQWAGVLSGAASTFGRWACFLVEADGVTIRATLRSLKNSDAGQNTTTSEWISGSGTTNSAATAQDGDFLVLELGYNCSASNTACTLVSDGPAAVQAGGTPNGTGTSGPAAQMTFSGTAWTFYPPLEDRVVYLRTDLAATGFLPAGYLAGWTTTIAAGGGANAKSLSTTNGSTQATMGTGGSVTGGIQAAFAQLVLTKSLRAQTIPAMNWLFSGAYSSSSIVGGSVNIYLAVYQSDLATLRGVILAKTVALTGTPTTNSVAASLFNAELVGSSVVCQLGDVLVLELAGPSGSGSRTFLLYSSGTTANYVASTSGVSDVQSFLIPEQPLLFPPPIIAGTSNLASGSGALDTGTATVVSIAGTSLLNGGSALNATGNALTIGIAGTANLTAGSAVAAQGTLVAAITTATATVNAGSQLTAAGIATPTVVAGVANLAGGSAIADTPMLPTMGSAVFAGGSGISAIGSVGGVVSVAAEMDAGSQLAAQGATQVLAAAGTAELDSGSALSAGGTTIAVAIGATSELDAGSRLAAQGSAVVTVVAAVGTFDSGSALAATGTAVAVAVVGVAGLASGSALVTVPMVPVTVGAVLAAGSMLTAQGSVNGATTGVAELDAGSALAAAGVARLLEVAGTAALASGACVYGLGDVVPAVVQHTATFDAGSNITAAGITVVRTVVAAADFAAGSALTTTETTNVPTVPEIASLAGGSAFAAQGTAQPIAVIAVSGLASGATLFTVAIVQFPPVVVSAQAMLAAGSALRTRGVVADTGVSAQELLRTLYATFSEAQTVLTGVLSQDQRSCYGVLDGATDSVYGRLSGDTRSLRGVLSGDQGSIRGVLH